MVADSWPDTRPDAPPHRPRPARFPDETWVTCLVRNVRTAVSVHPRSPMERFATSRDAYQDELSLEQARRLYFQRNGFGADGGYGARWVTVRLGPLPFSFPNSAARVRAVRYHDLHHIVTGYRTNLVGEAEIASFELASGCTRFPAAYHLNLGAL